MQGGRDTSAVHRNWKGGGRGGTGGQKDGGIALTASLQVQGVRGCPTDNLPATGKGKREGRGRG